jgi:hypothetical protein
VALVHDVPPTVLSLPNEIHNFDVAPVPLTNATPMRALIEAAAGVLKSRG